MDIAKIRKKALSKDAGSKPIEKLGEKPVSGPAEDENREDAEEKQAVVEAKDAATEEMPAAGITAEIAAWDEARDDDKAGIAAGEDSTEADAVELVELLTFSLSNEEYAFRVSDVEEVLRMQKITMVPAMPYYVLGITSLRGKIIPVIDLKTRLGLQEKSLSTNSPCDGAAADAEPVAGTGKHRGMENKILIISGPKGMIGAAIDRVMGVVRLPLSGMLQPPGHLDEKELKFIEGIVVIDKRFISIIHSEAAMDIEAG
ncbi:MAG: chemotaxis protein CheW [Thermodesulfovibrionales bacterium]